MLYYDKSQSGVNMTIGKDAGYYHKECSNVLWNEERQPYGYAGVRRLFEALAGGITQLRGLRKYLTPFAPDQSGAVSCII